MRVVVPFDAAEPKTRLDGVLDADERAGFADAMCRDVLAAIRDAGEQPTVLATAPVDVNAPVAIDERPLTDCVNARLRDADGPVAIIMADLALATPDAIRRLLDADGDVVLAPGRGGGTNALLSRHPDFRVDYHGTSYLDHRRNAEAVGATVTELDSLRLGIDVDERADLADLLVLGDGRATDWVRDRGFRLVIADGRTRVER
jgi:2-phospho-L-lactate guanylyltransferase